MAIKRLKTSTHAEYLVTSLVAGTRTYVAFDQKETLLMHNDKCPHRGGPLHLGECGENGIRKCPWHGMSIRRLQPPIGIAGIHIASKHLLVLIENTSDQRSVTGFVVKEITPTTGVAI